MLAIFCLLVLVCVQLAFAAESNAALTHKHEAKAHDRNVRRQAKEAERVERRKAMTKKRQAVAQKYSAFQDSNSLLASLASSRDAGREERAAARAAARAQGDKARADKVASFQAQVAGQIKTSSQTATSSK